MAHKIMPEPMRRTELYRLVRQQGMCIDRGYPLRGRYAGKVLHGVFNGGEWDDVESDWVSDELDSELVTPVESDQGRSS